MSRDIEQKKAEWFIETLRNPLKWCEAFLRDPTDPDKPFSLRSYQSCVLEDTRNYKNMVLRYGRRTGKTVTMCADMLWWTAAQPLADKYEKGKDKPKPIKALVFTPMDSQIKMIFDTLLDLIADSPFLNDMITKIKRSDVSEIHFSNGSIIKGMTIGISSGNKGTSIRGQSGDYIYVDEMDFIPRDIFEETILPIASTNADTRMRVTSTPSGRRDLFYEWCTHYEKLGWYHKHIPSWHPDNTNWISIKECEEEGLPVNQSTEYQFRNTVTPDAYEREFGAEFGEELQGVYKNDLIDKSLYKYCQEYISHDTDIFDPGFKQTPGNIYIIGVDWNSYKNGGQVVVLEYCRKPTYIKYFDHDRNKEVLIDCTNKFRLFFRRGVRAHKATQRETRKEIYRLLRLWDINYIYVDYGAGDTNVEELTFYGKDHPELGISEKLYVIDSGSWRDHYDHIIQKTIKKRMKSLMINQSVMILEEGRCILPLEEDNKQRLVNQMRGYTIKSITAKGDFTYDGIDHILDAWVLAVWGFHDQFSKIITNEYATKIKFMDSPRLDMFPEERAPINSILNTNNGNMGNIVDPDKPIHKFNRPTYISLGRGSNLIAAPSCSRRMF